MKNKKILTLSFMLLLIAGISILIFYCTKINTLLNTTSFNSAFSSQYNLLQKQTNVASIIIFIVLLVVGFINFYIQGKANYIAIANLLYIPITLFNYVTLNSKFYHIQGLVPKEEGGFWLILFIGIFYIVGAILVSVIGFFTIKNVIKRTAEPKAFGKRK